MRYVILVCSLLVALSGWYGYSGRVKMREAQAHALELQSALQAQTAARVADAKAFQIVGATKSAVIVQRKATDARIKKALVAESIWADAVVPSGALDAAGL